MIRKAEKINCNVSCRFEIKILSRICYNFRKKITFNMPINDLFGMQSTFL